MKAQAIETQSDVVGGAMLDSILDGLSDLYEQKLLEPPAIDSLIIEHLPEGVTNWALPRADVVDLLGRAGLIRAQLAAGVSVPMHPSWM